MNQYTRRRSVPWLRAAVALTILFAVSQTAHAFTTIAAGPNVNAGIGIAADPTGSAVYFTDWSSGKLKRIVNNPPGCTSATPCPVQDVATGFSHPQDVALDLAHNAAYVTTRDDPGTSGALWRVDTTTGAKSLITFNLGAPHQIVLDVATDSAYVVGFTSGRIWHIDLGTGSKTTLMSGLISPVGLAITNDRARAYVTEQAPSARVAEIDLATHTRIRNVVTGLSQPFYVSWTDAAQVALYVVERSPADLRRVDLPTATSAIAAGGLPANASGVAVASVFGAVYITANTSVIRIDQTALPMTEPVFLGIGNVPSTAIDSDGYADTTSIAGYFYQVKDAPFGGTLNIFGNFTNFTGLTGRYYRVHMTKDGGPDQVLMQAWSWPRWNPATGFYEAAPIAPDATGRYEIPSEYVAGHPERWYPPFIMMRWPSGTNGTYTFSVELLAADGTTAVALPPAKNQITVKIDNDPIDVDLVSIFKGAASAAAGGTLVNACDIVSAPPNLYFPRVTAHDPDGHLLSYSITAYWGHNQSESLFSDSYSAHVNAEGLHLWSGVTNQPRPVAGWAAHCNCAHTFFVDAWKRTIDGYSYLIHGSAHQSITINNTLNPSCP